VDSPFRLIMIGRLGPEQMGQIRIKASWDDYLAPDSLCILHALPRRETVLATASLSVSSGATIARRHLAQHHPPPLVPLLAVLPGSEAVFVPIDGKA
jgi:hypothetical protein